MPGPRWRETGRVPSGTSRAHPATAPTPVCTQQRRPRLKAGAALSDTRGQTGAGVFLVIETTASNSSSTSGLVCRVSSETTTVRTRHTAKPGMIS